ncbi:uncharacterized protein AB675_7554 [Cyphellophora attinorum]|uniref:Uncharacterized protein n=1 Tax=Cyphellophora attinorum TaxID=1664694 RepID=A0A0N1NZD0_9EURO|nr:uncharacterized protein AB675_7554 [Phialophora attinorum]KPI40354.1 hypothetical protein AB675_7554 [Phialophora attinorum]
MVRIALLTAPARFERLLIIVLLGNNKPTLLPESTAAVRTRPVVLETVTLVMADVAGAKEVVAVVEVVELPEAADAAFAAASASHTQEACERATLARNMTAAMLQFLESMGIRPSVGGAVRAGQGVGRRGGGRVILAVGGCADEAKKDDDRGAGGGDRDGHGEGGGGSGTSRQYHVSSTEAK